MTEDAVILESPGTQTGSHLVQNVIQFVRLALYRKNVILATLLVVGLLGLLYAATATRYYQADAEILILQSGGEELVPSINMGTPTTDVMPTYKELLRSAVVLEGALAKLDRKHRIDFQSEPHEKWIEKLRKNLSVTALRRTKLLNVKYRSKDPMVAEHVVGAVIDSYLAFIERTHRGTANQIINVLETEQAQLELALVATREQLLQAKAALGDFGTHSDGTILNPVIQTAIQLNEALIDAQKTRLDYQAMLAGLERSVETGENLEQHILNVERVVGREILLTGLGFNNRDARILSDLERGLLADQAEAKTLLKHYGPNHPRINEINNRIETSRRYLTEYRGRMHKQVAELQAKQLGPMLLQMVKQALIKAQAQEAGLRETFAVARQEAIDHEGSRARVEILDHDVARLERLNDILIEKIANTDILQEQGDVRATITQLPKASKRPVWPRLPVVALLCLLAAMVLGGTIVYVQDILDDRFRSPEELSMRLGVQVLAMIRELPGSDKAGLQGVLSFSTGTTAETEAFRTLRTALALNAEETERIVVSSAEPGDGKTTVLANLAVTFAQGGKKTLLIDADMRRPGMTTLLDLRHASGLSDVLHSDREVAPLAESLVLETDQQGLFVLPSGPRRPNPAELLNGPRMGELLAWADANFDQVLIDSPPVLAASDTLMIGRLVDGVILVVRPEKNRRRFVTRAVESFNGMRVNVLGIAANCVAGEGGKSYGFSYDYNYGYGYGGYGYSDAGEDEVDYAPMVENESSKPEIDFGPRDNRMVIEEARAPAVVPRRAA